VPSGRHPVATEAVGALKRHIAAVGPLLHAYKEVQVVGIVRLDS
jgi:hypothetical protein